MERSLFWRNRSWLFFFSLALKLWLLLFLLLAFWLSLKVVVASKNWPTKLDKLGGVGLRCVYRRMCRLSGGFAVACHASALSTCGPLLRATFHVAFCGFNPLELRVSTRPLVAMLLVAPGKLGNLRYF